MSRASGFLFSGSTERYLKWVNIFTTMPVITETKTCTLKGYLVTQKKKNLLKKTLIILLFCNLNFIKEHLIQKLSKDSLLEQIRTRSSITYNMYLVRKVRQLFPIL